MTKSKRAIVSSLSSERTMLTMTAEQASLQSTDQGESDISRASKRAEHQKCSCTVHVIDSFSEWENMGTAWNNLLSQSSSDTVFLSWEWLFSWGESYLQDNDKLFIITVCEGKELIGIAPWFIRRTSLLGLPMNRIEFLGSPEAGSDYLDVFIKRGKEREVSLSVYDFLFGPGFRSWDCLLLRDIPSTSLFLLYAAEKIEEQGKYIEFRTSAFCPVAVLPSDCDLYFSRISPNRRRSYNRDLRIITSSNGATHDIIRGWAVADALEEFFPLYIANWGNEGVKLKAFLKKYLARCFDEDTAQLDLLRCDGNICAGLLHLRRGNTLSMYLMAVDKTFNPKVSIGNVIVGLSISRAIKEGNIAYDFLKGAEQYKFHWTNNVRSTLTVHFYTKKIVSVLLLMKNFLTYAAKVVLR